MTGFAEENSPTYDTPMTKAEFLAWVQGQQGHFELKVGQVIMHPGGSRRHATIIGRFVGQLISRLDPQLWNVVPTELAIAIGPDIRYPDVLVEHALQDGDALSTESPVVLIEVLSPSSMDLDMNIKLAEYTSLASLEAYIVASQDEAICWVWQRGGADRAFQAMPDEVKGRKNAIAITALDTSLPLSEIYRGIATI